MPVLQIVSKIQKRIQDLLERDENSFINEADSKRFQNLKLNDEDELLRSLTQSLPEGYEDRLVFLFTRLSQLFEAGVFIENSKQGETRQSQAQAYFAYGQVKAYSGKNKNKNLKIPLTSSHEILSVKSAPLLKKLALDQLDPENLLTGLVFQPTSEVSFILFSRKAEIWLRPFAQKVLEQINQGISRER